MFVLINLTGQVGGVVMVLARFQVAIACGVLFFIVCLQVSISFYFNIFKQFLNINLCILDRRLLNPLGHAVLAKKFGSHRGFAPGFGRVAG